MPTDDLEAQLAAAALATGDPTGWFDQLYAAGERGRVAIPWSRTEAHPLLIDWARARDLHGRGQRAVVVGCGLGADAEYLSSLGFTTTAFDISAAAIRLARRRYPRSQVHYTTADLLDPPAPWWRAFELVVEIIGTTRQLPPWPLRRDEIQSFAADGLDTVAINALPLPTGPDEQRWVAHFRRPTTTIRSRLEAAGAQTRTPNAAHSRPPAGRPGFGASTGSVVDVRKGWRSPPVLKVSRHRK
jgi:SAM-dependent methyltransferase